MPTYTDLGCFGHCDTIDTGSVAPNDGPWLINTTFNGQLVRIESVALTNAPIEFDASLLNENYKYEEAFITDTTGTLLPDSHFKFELKVNI